jgi:HEAT repeat protein
MKWLKLLQDPDPTTRLRAADYFCGKPDRRAVDELLPLLGDVDENVRATAATALGELAPQVVAAVPGLASLLDDQNVSVRRSAALALARFGNLAREATHPLIRALRDEDECAVTQH